MLLGDPHDKGPSDSGWSVDWRFDQLLMKLKRHDLMPLAVRLARYRFGTGDLSLLTRQQKAMLVTDCEKELAATTSGKDQRLPAPNPL
ncbi:hypothetical protein [Stappia sp. MMSF_3263]|uniref:hypothetical protein n=1 Tax=Stappia sp. MMSF_3263 TaxID=3046693 RepID=UPI00273DED4A|nr:hypothetical protein [Stappia sp. MMSF_3263]